MARSLTRFPLVIALAVSLGGHWALLQCVAWTAMLISYSQQTSFSEAVCMTFDGQHPCQLCKVIQAGKAKEHHQQKAAFAPDFDLKLGLPPACFVLCHPPVPAVLPWPSAFPGDRTEPPPTPPPIPA